MEQMESKEQEQRTTDDCSEREISVVNSSYEDTRGGRSSLPMVDIENMLSDVSLNNWDFASNSFAVSHLPSMGSQLPWLFVASSDLSAPPTFINVATKTKYILRMPAFFGSLLCSKDGWLLCRSKNERNMPCLLFLFNPFTGEILDLPSMERGAPCLAAFSTNNSGVPNVVALVFDVSGSSIFVARPGDRMWEVLRFDRCELIDSSVALSSNEMTAVIRRQLLGMAFISAVFVKGSRVFCFFDSEVFVHDLTDGSWSRFLRLKRSDGYLVDCGSEIFKVKARLHSRCYIFSRLQADERGNLNWVKMKVKGENRSWFLQSGTSFSVKGEGEKVYRLCSVTRLGDENTLNRSDGDPDLRDRRPHEPTSPSVLRPQPQPQPQPQREFSVVVDDLKERVTSDLLPSPISGVPYVQWVQL